MTDRRLSKQDRKALEQDADALKESLPGGGRWRALDYFLSLALMVVLAFGIRAFLAEPVRVDGDSMIPTLYNGQMMLCEKVTDWFGLPPRGQIVIVRYPNYTKNCVKRVIGLPGETLEIYGGVVFINGTPLDESAYWVGTIYRDYGPVTVPEDSIFVMGDNRNGSKDSRHPDVGPIPREHVIGRVFKVF